MSGHNDCNDIFVSQCVLFDGLRETSYLHMPYNNYSLDMAFLLCGSFDEL